MKQWICMIDSFCYLFYELMSLNFKFHLFRFLVSIIVSTSMSSKINVPNFSLKVNLEICIGLITNAQLEGNKCIETMFLSPNLKGKLYIIRDPLKWMQSRMLGANVYDWFVLLPLLWIGVSNFKIQLFRFSVSIVVLFNELNDQRTLSESRFENLYRINN